MLKPTINLSNADFNDVLRSIRNKYSDVLDDYDQIFLESSGDGYHASINVRLNDDRLFVYASKEDKDQDLKECFFEHQGYRIWIHFISLEHGYYSHHSKRSKTETNGFMISKEKELYRIKKELEELTGEKYTIFNNERFFIKNSLKNHKKIYNFINQMSHNKMLIQYLLGFRSKKEDFSFDIHSRVWTEEDIENVEEWKEMLKGCEIRQEDYFNRMGFKPNDYKEFDKIGRVNSYITNYYSKERIVGDKMNALINNISENCAPFELSLVRYFPNICQLKSIKKTEKSTEPTPA